MKKIILSLLILVSPVLPLQSALATDAGGEVFQMESLLDSTTYMSRGREEVDPGLTGHRNVGFNDEGTGSSVIDQFSRQRSLSGVRILKF